MTRVPLLAVTAVLLTTGAATADTPNFHHALHQIIRPAVEWHVFEFVLLGMLFLVLTLALERTYTVGLRRDSFLLPAVQRTAAQTRDKPDELLAGLRQVTRDHAGPHAAVMARLLDRQGQPFAVLESACASALEVEEDRVNQPAGYLTLAARLAPLIGLIGTVCGIMTALKSGGGAESGGAVVSRGLGAALACTGLGIAVAAVAAAVAGLSRQRTTTLMKQMRLAVNDLLPRLSKSGH